MPYAGGMYILYKTSEYSDVSGGTQYGWETVFISKDGKKTELTSCVWRHRTDPRRDTPDRNYTKILGVENDRFGERCLCLGKDTDNYFGER